MRAKRLLTTCLTSVAIGIVAGGMAQATPTLDFSSNSGSTINFTGNGTTSTFDFTHSGGSDFTITSESGGSAAVGLKGDISGSYTIGAPVNILGAEVANVTGTGTIAISDGNGGTLSANLSWLNVVQVGTGSTLDFTGQVNLTNVSYSSPDPNADLAFLADAPTGTATLTFQFAPAESLTQLAQAGAENSTSYSGALTTPAPASFVLLLSAVMIGLCVPKRWFAAVRG